VLDSAPGGSQVRVRTPQPAALQSALTGDDIRILPQRDGSLLVTGVNAATVGRVAYAASIELHELTGEKVDLEAVFLSLTTGTGAIR
jgi:ABC-2 type transport system ATP-binding protein